MGKHRIGMIGAAQILKQGVGNHHAAERKTRYAILTKMKDASADATLAGFSRSLSRVPQAMRTSMTYDQGKEMAQDAELSKMLNLKPISAIRKALGSAPPTKPPMA